MPKRTSDTRVWDALYKSIKKIAQHEVRVGVFEDSGVHAPSGLSNVEIMAIHEYGSEAASVPGRAPIKTSTTAKKREIGVVVEEAMKKMFPRGAGGRFTRFARDTLGRFTGKRSGRIQGLGEIGERVAKIVREYVLSGPYLEPALSPVTIARKGHDRPLVDTSDLAESVTFKVEKRS